MPELPEVETVVHSLRPEITGATIVKIESVWPKAVATPDTVRKALNQKIITVERRGKFIILRLEKGALIIHLRMTGRLYTGPRDELREPYLTAVLHFRSGKKLHFQDPRKFGRIWFTADTTSFFSALGPEPLSRIFTTKWLVTQLGKRKRLVKPLLLDQSFIAGLGNIYADEALYQAGIQPLSLSHKIPATNIRKLHHAIRKLLRDSIHAQGTTVINFRFGDNRSGSFQRQLRVYGRPGAPCFRCKTPIVKLIVGQRGTHVCPKCQTLFK